MAEKASPNAALKAGEDFLVEARDSLNSLLRQLRKSGGDVAGKVSSELASFLDEARTEGTRVVKGLRGVSEPSPTAKKSTAKKSAAKKSTAKKSAAKKKA